MKCFNHHEVDAVGICKNCNKALCVNCYTDLGDGLACKDKHEEKVKHINSLIEVNSKLTKKYTGVILYFVLGAIFLIDGIMSKFNGGMMLGSVFIIFSIYTGYTVYKSKQL